jgi:hypothetical protein
MPNTTIRVPADQSRTHHKHSVHSTITTTTPRIGYSSRTTHHRPGNLLVGFFLLTGLFIGCALLASSLTISATTSSLTGSGLLSVAAASIGLSMLATGTAVLIYLAAGAISSVYAGFQTYNSSKTGTEALKDVVYFNRYLDEKRSLKGIFTAITAVLVSPFLLIGGLSGLAFKASITAYRNWNKTSLPTSDIPISSSYNSSLQKLSDLYGICNPIENKAPVKSESRTKDREILLPDGPGFIDEYTPLLTSTPNSSPSNRSHEEEEYSDEKTPRAWYFHS